LSTEDEWKNQLYFGDNLDILREYVPSESIDLVHLDPPFNSNATYNILFREKTGEKSAAGSVFTHPGQRPGSRRDLTRGRCFTERPFHRTQPTCEPI
jgi:16S rRNA G966 N2-methylase RsmD